MSTRRNRLRRNDVRFVVLARSLSAADWQQPSLFTGWTNHEALAHIVYGYQAPPLSMSAEIIRNGGSFDRAKLCAGSSARNARGIDHYGHFEVTQRRAQPERQAVAEGQC